MSGRVDRRDPGGGSVPLHDFDLHVDDGRVVAVEVTRHNVPSDVRMQAELARRPARRWTHLGHNWHLSMAHGLHVKDVLVKAPDLLAELEDAGVVGSFKLTERGPDPKNLAFAALRTLGVKRVYTFGQASKAGGMIDIGHAPKVGVASPEQMVDAAAMCALRKGKADKLARATADERHLFVWVENSQMNVAIAMDMGVLPSQAPELPAGVDVVWLANGFDPPHLWQFDRKHGWTDYGYVSDVHTAA